MPDDEQTDFWRFSLELYALPGVADAALTLQDQHQLDVNVAFACLYAGLVLGAVLDEAALASVVAVAEPWSAVAVRPLRAVRRGLKRFDGDPESAALRHRVQLLELEAERLAQRRIAAKLPRAVRDSHSFDCARANLLTYAGDEAQQLLACVRDGLAGVSP